ncbi:hypothetical protein [Lacipirellula sp.]|uniref:hypothetical protein n=1 Tax=Lacipirellula sp. TaxID=2691419 RepID=UPI003D0DDEC6
MFAGNDVRVVAVDSPPPPQVIHPQQQFVGYETDAYRLAHAFAREQMARKYPKSVEYLEAEDAMLQQHLKAQK